MTPLEGVRIIELGGIGPAPYAGMLLADLGAEVIRIDRVGRPPTLFPSDRATEVLDRGKRSMRIDLKHPQGRAIVLEMAGTVSAVIEGFRPGVTERLGLGPAELLAANPGLVYGRVTGWGQEGPLAPTAGHDIDYLAVAGALGAIGGDDPVVPLNLVADFAGGAMFLVTGVLAGVIAAHHTGRGTVVDAAMVDGVAHLTSMMHGGIAGGWWTPRRNANPLDGHAPFYSVYRTSDGEHMAVGALEPAFFAELIDRLGLDPGWVTRQWDRSTWDEMRREIAAVFASGDRSHWIEWFSQGDACVAPVLSLSEAPTHPHLVERSTFVDVGGVVQPAPAPRFDGRLGAVREPVAIGADTGSILAEMGYTDGEVAGWRSAGVIG